MSLTLQIFFTEPARVLGPGMNAVKVEQRREASTAPALFVLV